MCVNLMNWACASILIYVYGRTAMLLLRKGKGGLSDCAAAGVAAATVFAECWSLFRPVNSGAFPVFALTGAVLLAVLVLRRELFAGRPQFSAADIIPAVLIGSYFLAVSALWPSSYDDYLYHAQALRWTEEYGAVRGLGNLHCRLAYNSAFLSLQALFSWRDAAFPGKGAGISLHTMNGLLAAALGIYSLVPLVRELRSRFAGKGPGLAACALFTRIAALIYLFGNTQAFTGLDTDPMALIGILFVFIRLSDALSEEGPFTENLAFLSVFAAFLCTVKLSAAALLFLCAWPAAVYLREKKFRTVLFFLALAAAVTLPFFARGVLLSGYLVYPYTGIDLFNPDWKMSAGTALLDREGIILWGRGLYGEISEGRMTWPEAVSLPFARWFPIWYRGISTTAKALMLLCAASLVWTLTEMAGGAAVRHSGSRNSGSAASQDPRIEPGCAHRDGRKDFLYAAAVLCLAFWLVSAPLERYGSVFLLIVLSQVPAGGKPGRFILSLNALILAGLLAVRIASPLNYHGIAVNWRQCAVTPLDYAETGMREAEIAGPSGDNADLKVYVPESGDRSDYLHFPAAVSEEELGRVMLRGNSFADGFKLRP